MSLTIIVFDPEAQAHYLRRTTTGPNVAGPFANVDQAWAAQRNERELLQRAAQQRQRAAFKFEMLSDD